jgi:hypothetical protein
LWRFYWRDKHRDTVIYAPTTDSVPAPVVRAARACASRFTVTTVAEYELLNLAQLYLWSGQTDLSRTAIDRLLQVQKDAPLAIRSRTLQLVSTSFLDARPTYITDARKYLTQLDALGTPAALWRLLAHTDFAEHAMTLNDIGTAVSDARTAVAAAAQMDQSDRIDWVYPILFAYQTLAEPLAIQSSGPTVLALFDTVATNLLPLRPRGSREWKRLQTNIEHARSPYSLFGTDAKTLTATHWYH